MPGYDDISLTEADIGTLLADSASKEVEYTEE